LDTGVSVARAIPPSDTRIPLCSTNKALRGNEELEKLWRLDLECLKGVRQLYKGLSSTGIQQEVRLLIKFAQEMRLQDLQETSEIKLAEIANEGKKYSGEGYMYCRIFLKKWIVHFEMIICECNLKKCDFSQTEAYQNMLIETKKEYIEKLKGRRRFYVIREDSDSGKVMWDKWKEWEPVSIQVISQQLLIAARFTLEPEKIKEVVQIVENEKLAAFAQYQKENSGS